MLSSQTKTLREQMTKKQKPKVETEMEVERDDPPPDDFHEVNTLANEISVN